MAAETEPQEMATIPKALELAAQVAARRISNVIANENGSRVMYAIVDLGCELTSAIARTLAALARGSENRGSHPPGTGY